MNTNKEKSLLSQKRVHDITAFTTTDYPDHLACILWFSGCNMRCVYCYNRDIVLCPESSLYSYEDVFEFLNRRQGLLDGVVLSGGEALEHNLFELCTIIKSMGFKIKLDTNGLHTNALKQLILYDVLDYVALDFKAPKSKFYSITKSKEYERFEESLRFVIGCGIAHEVRTTLHSDLLNVDDINEIINTLVAFGYKNSYFIQNFLLTPTHLSNIKEPIHPFDKSRLSQDLNVVFR